MAEDFKQKAGKLAPVSEMTPGYLPVPYSSDQTGLWSPIDPVFWARKNETIRARIHRRRNPNGCVVPIQAPRHA